MEAIAKKYIETFNELDPVKRRALIAAVFTEDCRYTDPHADVHGHAEMEGFIQSARARMPTAIFTLKGAVDHHHDQARFQWSVAMGQGKEPFAIGFDSVVVENGRIKRVYGFIDHGREQDMQEAVQIYLRAWNERDETKRQALLARVYAQDAVYTDPLVSVTSLHELSAVIGHVQKEYPDLEISAGSRFDAHHVQARFDWVGKIKGQGDPVVVGFDIARFEGGKIKDVLGFIDRAPPVRKN